MIFYLFYFHYVENARQGLALKTVAIVNDMNTPKVYHALFNALFVIRPVEKYARQ